ncbi:MAG TPA: NAD(P)/FAD-dependent oxidoreductase [Dongiaceae bacterium]|nr:NAD(P)/FAD-dependent oxidoreductase [Dongiaceae bacterium]
MSARYDLAVIGGGVVGCALFRRFALGGLKPILMERAADILAGASKGNSAMLHTGFDAPTGSLEQACVQAGYREYLAIREALNLPLLETGGLMAAWTTEELGRLPGIVAAAHANGVHEVRQIDAAEVRRREPGLAADVLGGVLVPGEHVIDPWSAPLAYALQGIALGGEVRRRCEVTGGAFDGRAWRLATTEGAVEARVVVNAAGLRGDLVEAIARPSPFAIKPRKGQFVVFDKPAARLIGACIMPVPSARTKGVMVARTVFGNLLVGPTAEEQEDRDHAALDRAQLEALIARGRRILPALAGETVTAAYAGLRPATGSKDYLIEALPDRNWITAAGIRSTGLTGALGIALHAAGLYRKHFGELGDTSAPTTPVPNLAEHLPRRHSRPGYGEMVCHCELVTRAEIEEALSGPLPAGDLGGLRRRTRAMMGRCQGFYCSARVAALARGRIAGFPGAAA